MLIEYPLSIKSYLYKYVAYYNNVEPYFSVTEKHRYGVFIRSQLKHKKQAGFTPNKHAEINECVLRIAIKENDQQNIGFIFGENEMVALEKIIKDEFQERFIEFIIDNKTKKKGSIYPSILKFRERYEISEDELPFKTMVKWWERKRNRIYSIAS